VPKPDELNREVGVCSLVFGLGWDWIGWQHKVWCVQATTVWLCCCEKLGSTKRDALWTAEELTFSQLVGELIVGRELLFHLKVKCQTNGPCSSPFACDQWWHECTGRLMGRGGCGRGGVTHIYKTA